MEALAVVMKRPESLSVDRVLLTPPGAADVVVDVDFSGISTGTERLLWSGRMPPFPGMGYPLVPGYELVGRVVAAGPRPPASRIGETVFVPGASCFGTMRGLFGGAASRARRAGRARGPDRSPDWASAASCSRWPPRPSMRSSAKAGPICPI